MKIRAAAQAATRQKIVEATVDLHTTLGPAYTTISAIAERAGVQRHTVYAHFPDEYQLFRACTNHWRDAHPFPEAARWISIADPARRLRSTLTDIYGWYDSVADEFELFVRDSYVFPDSWQEREGALAALAPLLAAPFGRSQMKTAAVAHALEFSTWRSLTRRQGLSDSKAAKAMTAFVEAA